MVKLYGINLTDKMNYVNTQPWVYFISFILITVNNRSFRRLSLVVNIQTEMFVVIAPVKANQYQINTANGHGIQDQHGFFCFKFEVVEGKRNI